MGSQRIISAFLLLILAAAAVEAATQDRTRGGIKGKVRDERSAVISGVTVIARQGEREMARATTNRKGEFVLAGLEPGSYGLTFHKPGLSTGTLEGVEVRAGKVRSLSDHLILKIDEGSIAFLRGSVFTPEGRSVRGARVELARLEADGIANKIDGRMTSESGEFVFRLAPVAAKYRVTVKVEGAETATKDVEIDGAAVYRIALSLQPAQKK